MWLALLLHWPKISPDSLVIFFWTYRRVRSQSKGFNYVSLSLGTYKSALIQNGNERETNLEIRCESPMPLTVLFLNLQLRSVVQGEGYTMYNLTLRTRLVLLRRAHSVQFEHISRFVYRILKYLDSKILCWQHSARLAIVLLSKINDYCSVTPVY